MSVISYLHTRAERRALKVLAASFVLGQSEETSLEVCWLMVK